ncbi:MAG: hypothetical protein O7B99_00710 [Planctomycetota bacterium]|nr:hypothetical protein [Planctomycetota bacterium]
MRYLPLLMAFLAWFSPPADSQILAIYFKDEKAAKKFKKHTTTLGGEIVLLGEPVPKGGIWLEDTRGSVTVHYKGGDRNELFVVDAKDPSNIPYRIEDGVPVAKSKRNVLSVHGKYIKDLRILVRSETIETLGREYELRMRRIDESKAKRDVHKKGTVEWFSQHRLVLGDYERLISWLANMSFSEAAEKLQKELKKEAKAVAEEATHLRAQRALESIIRVGTPEDLAAAAQTVEGGKHEFKIQESEHMRMVYLVSRFSDAEIKLLLKHGEKVIEGFRNRFVDPYIGEDFAEHIPDDKIIEWYFGPHEPTFHFDFTVEYYEVGWSEKRKERLSETQGHVFTKSIEPRLLFAWMIDENEDMEGIVTHNLGHVLAGLHWNGDAVRMQQPWMEEGLAYYLSFEFLGRNSVTCKSFDEGNYVRPAGRAGRKTVQMGYRETLNAVALEDGPRIDRLMLKSLAEMEDPDLAKSWSFFDYVAQKLDKDGQRWMRATCEYSRNKSTFIEKLREFSEGHYGVQSGTDIFQALDDRWREYAQAEMDMER